MKSTLLEFKTYDEVVEYFNNSSMFSIKLGLDRVKRFLTSINNPQNSLKIVHIAGTNGKGSVLKYLETILIKSKLKIGSFTSPHLVDFTERISINNNQISRDDFLAYSNKLFLHLNHNNLETLTLFEFLTVLAFMYFADNNVDIVLLETGLGGTYDATNVIDKSLISVITSISLDHTEYLGETIAEIAAEKGGIIKVNCPVVVSQDNQGLNVISKIAYDKSSKLFISSPYEYEMNINVSDLKQSIIHKSIGKKYEVNLTGKHQLENATLALKVIEVLTTINYKISSEAIQNGLKETHWPCRAQYFKAESLLVDGAHNPAGAFALRNLIDLYFPDSPLVWILGTLKTKNSCEIIKNLVRNDDIIILTRFSSKDSTSIDILEEITRSLDLKNTLYKTNSPTEAYKLSKELQTPGTLTIITGSLYLAGEFIKNEPLKKGPLYY